MKADIRKMEDNALTTLRFLPKFLQILEITEAYRHYISS